MLICLMIYHQIPVPDIIAIHLHLSVGQTSILHMKKYRIQPGFEPRATGIPSLHSTTELPNHVLICLRIYHQIRVPDFIAIHLHLSMGRWTDVLAKDILARTFQPERFGHRCFGQIRVQSRTFWPNTISTCKEASYELFMLLYI